MINGRSNNLRAWQPALAADEGFGVRAAEKLFEQYADNEKVDAADGGIAGWSAAAPLQQTEKLLIMDAIDFGMAPVRWRWAVMNRFPAYLTAKNSAYIRPVF